MCGKVIHFVSIFLIVLSCATNLLAQDLCDSTNGAPSDVGYCMLIPNYDTYQRAECGRPPFTTASGQNVTCADDCRDYCWLPCMVKEFDQHNGTVDQACTCEGDRNQTCQNATGSVKYYTECLNTTARCTSPSYIDFADFYFNWLSEKIIEGNNCTDSGRLKLKDLRLCVENKVRDNFEQLTNGDCESRGSTFKTFMFDSCTASLMCPLDYYPGVLEYQRIFLNGSSADYLPTRICG